MALFRFRQGKQATPEPEPRPKRGGGRKARADAAAVNLLETVESLRRRARHRLIGAAVLVLAAVVGFPLLFDSEPRPLVVHAPIVIPDRDDAGALSWPNEPPPLEVADGQAEVDTQASLSEREEVVAMRGRAEVVEPDPAVLQAERARQEQARQEARRQAEAEAREKARIEAEARARQQAEAAERRREAEAQTRQQAAEKAAAEKAAAEKAAAEKKAAVEKAAAEKERAQREAARARAALEGRAGQAQPAAGGGRFVVQIGAFAQDDAVRDVRQKAERGGFKTYTQVVDTPQGKRTRVRMGPYASRAEAEQALVKLKLVGLDGHVQSQ